MSAAIATTGAREPSPAHEDTSLKAYIQRVAVDIEGAGPESHEPADPENFIALLTATIGDTPDSYDGDVFKVVVCSTEWLNARLEAGSMEFWYPLFTVERYDYASMKARVEDLISSLEDETWGELARKIGNFMRWEPRVGTTPAGDDWRRLIG